MTKKLGLLAALFLAACSRTPTLELSKASQECGGVSAPYGPYWACTSRQIELAPTIYPDLKSLYLANGNLLAERVSAGLMTTAEAQSALAQSRSQIIAASNKRDAAQSPNAIVCMPMGNMIVCGN